MTHEDEPSPTTGQGHDHSTGHDHGHDHGGHDHGGHDHDHPKGLRGVIKEVFAPHSHDASDSIDGALESSAAGIRAVKISLLALGATSIAQLVIVVISGSVALLADTIHNFSDALTAIPLWIAFALGTKAATRRYTYGYGRAEDLAGLFVVVMITLSAAIAAIESVRRLDPPRRDRACRLGRRGRAGRVHRQRTRRGLPHPRRPPDRLGRPDRRRLARAHRRIHLPGRAPWCRGRRVGLPAGRPHRRAS